MHLQDRKLCIWSCILVSACMLLWQNTDQKQVRAEKALLQLKGVRVHHWEERGHNLSRRFKQKAWKTLLDSSLPDTSLLACLYIVQAYLPRNSAVYSGLGPCMSLKGEDDPPSIATGQYDLHNPYFWFPSQLAFLYRVYKLKLTRTNCKIGASNY